MSTPSTNRSELSPQQRMNSFWKAREYHTQIYPPYAENKSSQIDMREYLERFNADFYQKAKKADSSQQKELKDYWSYDQKRLGLPISFEFWFPGFQQTMNNLRS